MISIMRRWAACGSVEGSGEAGSVVEAALVGDVGNGQVVILRQQLLGVLNADVESQLLCSDAQVGFHPAVELSAGDVELLSNVHERDVALRHVPGHYLTELSDESAMRAACEHCNIDVVNDIAKFAIYSLIYYAKWCIELA